MQDVYETDRLGTSPSPEVIILKRTTAFWEEQNTSQSHFNFQTENFFRKMEMKNVKDPIAFIDVQENGLYSKVNGILGLSKDAMKRKG